MKDRNGQQHRLRATDDPQVIERLALDTAELSSPIGGQDAQGRWYVDVKLAMPGEAKRRTTNPRDQL